MSFGDDWLADDAPSDKIAAFPADVDLLPDEPEYMADLVDDTEYLDEQIHPQRRLG